MIPWFDDEGYYVAEQGLYIILPFKNVLTAKKIAPCAK